MLLEVPVIDITPFRTGDVAARGAVAAAIGQAVHDIGFLVITGHGVDPGLIAQAQYVSNAFFDLPLAAKRAVLRPEPDVSRGYIPLEGESVGRSQGSNVPGDLNESFMIGPVDTTDDVYFTGLAAGTHFHPNLWPDDPPALRGVFEAYFRVMSALAADLMAMFALALGLQEGFFADKIDRHISRLRVRNYPAPVAPPLPGQLRAGAYSDYGSLTILRTEASPGGLQVMNRTGAWVDATIAPDSFIVNIGELTGRSGEEVLDKSLKR